MPVPTSEERPDLYDAYDFPAEPKELSPEYLDRVLPEHLNALGEARSVGRHEHGENVED